MQERLQRSVSRASHGVKVPSPEEAARLLLGERLDYGGSSGAVKPYDGERVSLPCGGSRPVELSEVLQPAARELLTDFENRLLVDPFETNPDLATPTVTPYLDEVFRRDRPKYLEFVRRLVQAGLVQASHTRRGSITPFFVWKKKNKLR